MIERISGTLVEKTPMFCVIDCQGIGIGCHISVNTFQFLERQETPTVQLLTYLHVREDAIQLFGFGDAAERNLFQLLISISGVGPKLALGILSGMSAADLNDAIMREDVMQLTKIPGVGKKTAQRLILELKEKVAKQTQQISTTMISGKKGVAQYANEAIMALTELGYRPRDAQKAVETVIKNSENDISLEEIVISALKKF